MATGTPEIGVLESPSSMLGTASPSPSASPTPALFACPPLERSVSTTSTASSFSRRSSGSRSSDTVTARRRGYARPQATTFADSARNRESVMSLGSIAHLQHYFARTGLLDGKGGQLLSSKVRKRSSLPELETSGFYLSTPSGVDPDSPYSMHASPETLLSPGRRSASAGSMMHISPDEQDGAEFDDDDFTMLPPTESTYNARPKIVPPPPSLNELRRDLRRCLADSRKIMEDVEKAADKSRNQTTVGECQVGAQQALPNVEVIPAGTTALSVPDMSLELQGWHELQGLSVLDTMTLTIRAAKMYYTAHEQPARLAAIRSERKLRGDLLGVLDVLKRMAVRNFGGGVRAEERATMLSWLDDVDSLLRQEEEIEVKEIQERQKREWMHGDWLGREREREWLFLESFNPEKEQLPSWTMPTNVSELPNPFLKEMQNGLRLVRLHNEMVRKSRRPFGQITSFHTDTLKPYRAADNLRYWIKAAELRWDMILRVDVMGVVHGRSPEVWRAFDDEILRWCSKVREEITEEWLIKPSNDMARSSERLSE